EPRRKPSIDEPVSVLGAQLDDRIKRPALRTGLGIERDHAVERRREIQRAVDDEWRRLEAAPPPAVRAVGDVAGVEGPRNLQPRDVGPIDLRERRVAHAAGVMAVVGPSVRVCALRWFLSGNREQGDYQYRERADRSRAEATHTGA